MGSLNLNPFYILSRTIPPRIFSTLSQNSHWRIKETILFDWPVSSGVTNRLETMLTPFTDEFLRNHLFDLILLNIDESVVDSLKESLLEHSSLFLNFVQQSTESESSSLHPMVSRFVQASVVPYFLLSLSFVLIERKPLAENPYWKRAHMELFKEVVVGSIPSEQIYTKYNSRLQQELQMPYPQFFNQVSDFLSLWREDLEDALQQMFVDGYKTDASVQLARQVWMVFKMYWDAVMHQFQMTIPRPNVRTYLALPVQDRLLFILHLRPEIRTPILHFLRERDLLSKNLMFGWMLSSLPEGASLKMPFGLWCFLINRIFPVSYRLNKRGLGEASYFLFQWTKQNLYSHFTGYDTDGASIRSIQEEHQHQLKEDERIFLLQLFVLFFPNRRELWQRSKWPFDAPTERRLISLTCAPEFYHWQQHPIFFVRVLFNAL